MNKFNNIITIILLSFILLYCTPTNNNHSYLDQELPGEQPEIFAPSIVNTDEIEINIVLNSTYSEVFFTRIINGSFVIHHSELIDGAWSKPKPIQIFSNESEKSVAIDPTITQDGNTMYFLGISSEDYSKKQKPDIYKSTKHKGKWQLATKVGEPISTDEFAESYPVVVADGSLYFTSDRPGGFGKRDIYRAQLLEDGTFDQPENIGPEINSERSARGTFVSADESILITSNITDEKGFFVSLKRNGKWQKPKKIEIGESLDNDWIYFCPYMSPENEYFFFSKRLSDPPSGGWNEVTRGEVYWVDAKKILF